MKFKKPVVDEYNEKVYIKKLQQKAADAKTFGYTVAGVSFVIALTVVIHCMLSIHAIG